MKTNPNDPIHPSVDETTTRLVGNNDSVTEFIGVNGLTKREHFAAMALQGLVMGSLNIITSVHINDFNLIERSWRERLFTLPWRPWLKTKSVYSPKIYKLGNGDIICSPRTLQNIKEREVQKPTKQEG